jgi:hypothetical protein
VLQVTLTLKRSTELFWELDMTMAEIKFAVGFQDVKHFRTLFKAQIGELPGECVKDKTLPWQGIVWECVSWLRRAPLWRVDLVVLVVTPQPHSTSHVSRCPWKRLGGSEGDLSTRTESRQVIST